MFAIPAGRLLDRRGPRLPLLAAGVAGAMALSSLQTIFGGFAAAYVLGCGLVGTTAYYHVTGARGRSVGYRLA
ncbi:MAG: hypothetical protein ACYCTE_06150 [Acidimicrobiales bacterium]